MPGGNLLTMRNYFDVNGKRYYTGTIFIVNNMGKHVEATFICYNDAQSTYVYKIEDCTWRASEKAFWTKFVSVTNKRNDKAHIPVVKAKKDLDIDGLFIGWMWYIFLMFVSVIFKDVIVLWILISIVFFNWRSKKIKEEGTYIEW